MKGSFLNNPHRYCLRVEFIGDFLRRKYLGSTQVGDFRGIEQWSRSGARPGHARPGHARPGHARPGHARPGHARPGHARPGHARPGHARPGHA
ncbi:hypothetical protein [Spirosoma sp.]|uniref:hypothetical protein n=1 Tax=Spirosoma sp. TaxID=1899569 RepID=UPI00261038EE|nr:hypothetical protein [Spirosoma sp.]